MTKVNTKSDFDLILMLWDKRGRSIGFPSVEFTAKLYTSLPQNAVKVTNRGGTPLNCYDDGDRLHIVVDNHRQPEGDLRCELTLEIPDAKYPDRLHRVVTTQALGIRLVREGADSDGHRLVTDMTVPTDMTEWGAQAATKKEKKRQPGVARLVGRIPSLNSEEGYAYVNHGLIKIGGWRDRGEGHQKEISLENIYWQDAPQSAGIDIPPSPLPLVPLSSFQIEARGVTVEKDGDKIIAAPNSEYVSGIYLRIKVGDYHNDSAPYIRVRRDDEGRKIFYASRDTPLVLRPKRPATSVLATDGFDGERRHSFGFNEEEFDVQVWRRVSRMHKKSKTWYREWRWKNEWSGTIRDRGHNTALVRVRKARKGTLASPWSYFHLDFRSGKVAWSIQRRT